MAARTPPRFLRPRTFVYAGVLSAVVLVMLGSWVMRDTLHLAVLRDRAPLYVRLSDGGVRNAYQLKLVNKTRTEESLVLVLDGPRGLALVVQDAPTDAEGRPLLATRADGIAQFRALVTAPPELRLPESTDVTFRLIDPRSGRALESEHSVFLGPKPQGAPR
jgi:polyferredoxin